MRWILALTTLCAAFAGGFEVAARSGPAAPARTAAPDARVDLVLRNHTTGRLSHGYVYVHDTGEWIPIQGTPDDDAVQEPRETVRVARVPRGTRIDLVAWGHDTGSDRPGSWASREHYVWGPFPQGRYTITLADR